MAAGRGVWHVFAGSVLHHVFFRTVVYHTDAHRASGGYGEFGDAGGVEFRAQPLFWIQADIFCSAFGFF